MVTNGINLYFINTIPFNLQNACLIPYKLTFHINYAYILPGILL